MAGEHDDSNSAYRRFERAAEWPMLVLSVVFLGLVLVPSVAQIEHGAVDLALILLWALFALEIVVLFALAPSKGRMFREHWLDVLIVVAPFLRPLRIGRLARVVRATGILGRAISGVAAVAQRRGLQIYGAVTVFLVLCCAPLVYAFEKEADGSNITSLQDALWWSVVTTTTVGYGDHYPVTTDARAVSVILMLVGVGLVGVVSANIAAHFVEQEQADELDEIRTQLDRIERLVSADRG